MLDLKLSYKAAVENGAAIDEELKRLSERRARTWASTLRSVRSVHIRWIISWVAVAVIHVLSS